MENHEHDSDEREFAEPFDIDDGELDGLSPQLIFTLGVEWQMFFHDMESKDEFYRDVHIENVPRLKAMCERHGRQVKEQWLHDDYEGHRRLVVSPPSLAPTEQPK